MYSPTLFILLFSLDLSFFIAQAFAYRNQLSLEGNSTHLMSFSDVVMGQTKHDVGRTFSALLQLVYYPFSRNYNNSDSAIA